MCEFIERQLSGFHLVVAAKYADAIGDAVLDELLAEACRCSSAVRREKKLLWSRQLPGRLDVHVKYWAPRREKYRLKTLWRPTDIEEEAAQYVRFTNAGLPVPELLMWGCRRLPGVRFGVYIAGLVVTRTLDGTRSLRTLLGRGEPPWVCGGRRCTREVLGQLAGLLVRVHRSRLVHGDYMLKNCLYAPGEREGVYWMVDLASGWPLPPGDPKTERGRWRDLLRMVLSLARNGLSREDVVSFLESYVRAWQGDEHARGKAEEHLAFCLSLPDHRATEAARLLGTC